MKTQKQMERAIDYLRDKIHNQDVRLQMIEMKLSHLKLKIKDDEKKNWKSKLVQKPAKK